MTTTIRTVVAAATVAFALSAAPAAHAAMPGATGFSDSTVTAAQGTSAVVSLGKLGRVE